MTSEILPHADRPQHPLMSFEAACTAKLDRAIDESYRRRGWQDNPALDRLLTLRLELAREQFHGLTERGPMIVVLVVTAVAAVTREARA